MPSLKTCLLLLSIMAAGCCWTRLCFAQDVTAKDGPLFDGKPLGYWVSQATADAGPADLERTVAALAGVISRGDPSAKMAAADSLAVLGPKSEAALPALLEQFGHEFPWVRVPCQAAAGSIGKQAVRPLIDVLVNNTGGPRIRAAFVLGGIGPDAVEAVPALVRIMKEESPAMATRIAGVLGQIDPDRFTSEESGKRVRYEGTAGASLDEIVTADWPRFHGPLGDSVCRESDLLQAWPEDGPRLLWKLTGLGRGYSTVSIAGGKIFTLGDRIVEGDTEAQFLIAYNLDSRDELWATRVGPPHSDGGPRSTPTVNGDLLYAVGTNGDLVCLETETGQLRWSRSFPDDFQGKFMAVWKFSESPLVDGDRLICTPGGPEATIVALDKRTGKVIWKCSMPSIGEKGADGAGYSSPVVAEICGIRQYVQMLGRGLIGVEAETGRFLWGYNRVANNVANITSPLIRGDYVFGSTAYNTGSVLLKISRQGDSLQAEEVYFLGPRDFQNHHGGVVLVGDHIFGGHGPNRGDPTCIEFGTGKIVWKKRAPARGSAAVLHADGHLIFRYDRGEILLIEASPKELIIKGRFEAPKAKGPAWAHPVIHKGKLYLRHDDSLLCYDLRTY